MKKYVLMAVSVTLPVVFMAGCGASQASATNTGGSNDTGSSSGVTNILIWDSYSQQQGTAFKKMVSQFNQSHPKIHITAQYITTQDAFLPKLMTAISGNQEPDLVAGGAPTWGPGLLDSGKVVDLDDYLKQSGTMKRSSFYPGMLEVSSYKGKVLSIPTDGGDYGILYNQDIFKQAGLNPNDPPKTWQDLLKDAVQIKKKTGDWGFYVPIGSGEWTVYTFQGLLAADGGTFIDTSGAKAKVEFNSQAGVNALQTWVDLIHKYDVAPSTPYPASTPQSQILEKSKIAMEIDGPWDVVPMLQAKYPLGTAMFPAGTKGNATGLGTNNMYIMATGKTKEDASWQFIQWFMEPSRQAQWDIDTGLLPTLNSVVNTATYKAFLKKNPKLQPLVDNLKYAEARPTLKSYSAISQELGTQIESALYGKESAKQALDTAAQQAKQILQQNNE